MSVAPAMPSDPWLLEQLLEQLLETAPVGLALLDPDLRYLRVNSALADINGIPVADHIGRTVAELLPGLPASALDQIRRVARGGAPELQQELMGETPAQPGVLRTWIGSYYPLVSPSGEPIGANVVVVEVTAERARERYVGTLQELAAALTSAGTVEEVTRAVLDIGYPAIGADRGAIRLVSADRRWIDVVATMGYQDAEIPPAVRHRPFDVADPGIAVALTGETLVFESDEAFVERFPDAVRLRRPGGARAFVWMPLQGGPVGALLLGWSVDRVIDPQERSFLTAMSRLCAQALVRTSTEAAARARSDAIARTMARIAAESDPAGIAATLLHEAMPPAGATFGLVRIVRPPDGTVVLHHVGFGDALDPALETIPLTEPSPTTDAIRTGQPVLLRDLDEVAAHYPALVPMYRRIGQAAAAAFPMLTSSGAIGAILMGFDAPQPFGDAQLSYARALAEAGAAGLDRARLVEEELRTRRLLAQTVEQLPVGVAIVDANLQLTFQNPATAQILGTDRTQSVLVGEDLPIARAARTGETTMRAEAVVSRPDGRVVALAASASPVFGSDGSLLGAVGVFTDVTDEQRAAEAREGFLGVLSHELRTPLTAIFGGSRILQRHHEAMPETARTIVDDVAAESLRLLRLVEDLLVIARVERGGLTGEQEPVLVHHLIRRLAEQESGQWPGLRLEVDLPQHMPMVVGDAGHLETVLRNLIGNAAKYGNGFARISGRRDGDQVVLEIEDDGPGLLLPRDQLFQLFRRGEAAERRAPGSGIGLFVCRALVETMGGTISARDGGDRGAVFQVRLSIARVDDVEEG